ncbi:DUF6266 family protein [Pedobacter frigoris]|uniref:DUF6266 family protein n=1 Tax=Pedobacter frigoris TaxID=2571272 RepID=UPI00292F33CB|nr:DUF6266 family protein [Pedobacter frigoris]
MSSVDFGPFGDYRGRLGNLVFYKLMGRQVVRRIGRSVSPSVAQLAGWQRMSVVNAFLKPIMPFINVGYAVQAQESGMFPQNAAVSYLLRYAVKGSYPFLEMDYSRVLVSRGVLAPAQNASVVLLPEGLRFSWSYDPSFPFSLPSDEVMVMAYFPGLAKAVFEIGTAVRSSGSVVLALPDGMAGGMELYISFVAVNRKEVSDSVYLGGL